MKNFMLFFLALCAAATGFAQNLKLDNQTSYPNKNPKSKIAVQWASSAREVAESNNALISGETLDPDNLQMLTGAGKVNISIPKSAEYFRVVVWSNGSADPDYLTNWVDVVPNKSYTIKPEYLIPTVLMSGMGC